MFAVPGNITSPLSAGCNALLKQGAIPATSVEDILEVINLQNQENQNPSQISLPVGDTPLENAIIELLNKGVRDGDELQKQAKAEISDFNTALTMLEINGIIKALGANKWCLR